jgi:hypothetical protein
MVGVDAAAGAAKTKKNRTAVEMLRRVFMPVAYHVS